MSRIYDFTCTPGGVFNLRVVGNYYRILTCTGPVEIRRDGGSVLGPINAGQGERETDFQQLTIVDKTGAANSGTILITDKNFVDDRITGEVSFVDGSRARTMSGAAFSGVITSLAVAGQASHAQIWNASTTKNAFISQMITSVPTSASIKMQSHAAPLATLATAPSNKKIGGPASVMQNRIEANVAIIPTGAPYGLFYMQGLTTEPYKLTEPIMIPPGQGLVIVPEAVNLTLLVNYEMFEEVIL